MPVEIEAKIKVEHLAVYADRLTQLGGQNRGQVTQRDHFFDRPDHSLRAADCGLRIRQATGQHSSENTICFKGPRQPGLYKQRQEIEFAIADPHAAQQLLQVLGYVVTLVFEKRRSVWHINECTVCLDEVAQLGHFVEIEGPGEATIAELQSLLGLSQSRLTQSSYAVLLAERLEQPNSGKPRQALLAD